MGAWMRILLTQLMPIDTIGGTQSWNETVAMELRRRGHSVGTVGRSGAASYFDLAIGSQWLPTLSEAGRLVYVSHGIIDHERPPEGADAYVAVSEEVRDKWDWPKPPTIIRQPIDLDFWHPDTATTPDIDVLRFGYYGGMEWLPGMCRDMGLSFHHMRNETDPLVIRHTLWRAGVVIASGRSALEAMACGRPVIVADERPYNGGAVIGGLDVRANYSGRGGAPADADLMSRCIETAQQVGGEPFRANVESCHDARKIVDQLLALVDVEVAA